MNAWISVPFEGLPPSGAYEFLEALSLRCQAGGLPDPEPMNAALEQGLWQLSRVISRAETKLTHTWYDDEWLHLCAVRSGLEWVSTLWGKGELSEAVAYQLDMEDLDDMLRQRAVYEGGLREDQIPPGTPRTHWWWWLKTYHAALAQSSNDPV